MPGACSAAVSWVGYRSVQNPRSGHGTGGFVGIPGLAVPNVPQYQEAPLRCRMDSTDSPRIAASTSSMGCAIGSRMPRLARLACI